MIEWAPLGIIIGGLLGIPIGLCILFLIEFIWKDYPVTTQG